SRFLYFKVFRWTMEGTFPDVKKCVVAVVPHTHWMDFFLGLVVRSILGKEINYIGKKSLFKPPFGWFFRWTGGAPIDRSKTSNTVDSVAAIFETRDVFRFALAPEGTRKKVTELKTGFYHIAKKANVPIVLVAFDFGKKQVKFSDALYPTNDMEADFQQIKAFFKGVKGKVPEYSF
ncbi:MAG: lysophospholipid acyltransferase family protein, partial [Bacteroidota bacterium]